MMMGLRLVGEGVSSQNFYERFGERLEERFAKEIRSLAGKGLIEWGGDSLRLTQRGRLLGNQVFVEFI
jgi:oxygen-independent coproporphyrinogen III oxidase